MREFFGTFGGYLKRGIMSLSFFACTALCALLMIFFVADQYAPEMYNTLPGLHYFLARVDNKGAVYFIMMLTAFPSATMFYEDWKSGNFKFIITRSGRVKYAFAVTLAAAFTAAAVMILSYIIFSIYVLVNFPAVTNTSLGELRRNTIGFPNSGLLYTGHILLCYILYFLTKGAMAAFFAMIAVFQSMIITNKNLTIISPVLVYIFYFSFNLFYILPAIANPFVLFRNGYKLYLVFGGTEDGSLFSPVAGVYPIIFSIVTMVVLALIETKILRSKMNKSL